jgi:hypothetical protein
MLKRYQVLLEDWQGDHLKLIAETYDLSFSEVIRLALSLGITNVIQSIDPKFKTTVDGGKIKEFLSPKTTEDKRHQLLSNLYFEARKAAEVGNGFLSKTKIK